MTLRKGQKLVNYIYKTRKKRMKQIRVPNFPEIEFFLRCQIVDQTIFYMSDEEFEKALK